MFTAGVTNVMVGHTGIYIGKIFEQSKSRPIYILKQTAGLPLITAGVSLFKEIESMKETGKVAALYIRALIFSQRGTASIAKKVTPGAGETGTKGQRSLRTRMCR